MAREKRAVINKRKMDMLAYLLQQTSAKDSDAAVLSIKQLRLENGLSEGQLRLILKKLEQEGLMKVQHRWQPNGGTAENAYEVTRKGLLDLTAYRQQQEEESA